jgi:hypothetical protein
MEDVDVKRRDGKKITDTVPPGLDVHVVLLV